MRKVIIGLAAVAVIGTTAACQASADSDQGIDSSGSESAAPATQQPTPTPEPEPEPVDPDEAFIAETHNDPGFRRHFHLAITQLEDWNNSTTLDEGSVVSHDLADSYDWLGTRMMDMPTSAGSPLAQQIMSGFRICRDAYAGVGDAIDNVDVAAMDIAGRDVQACLRELEGTVALR